jgi:hypothetical protein
MKTLVIALVSAILIAGQFFTPVSAASTPNQLAATTCGDTYTIQRLDNLAKIARLCDTTVSNILALNTWIVNPNLIYSGEVLRITGDTTATTDNTDTTYSGYARVRLSSTRAEAGDEITVSVSGFPANADIDYRVGEQGESYSIAYDGTTSSNGVDSQIITLPADADEGEIWVVQVITTDQVSVVDVDSAAIYISTYTATDSGNARVSLSTTQAASGDEVTVTISGFPANADIDYRVGEQGETYTVAYDGTTNSKGADSQTITLPSDADEGEYWVVKVITTGQAKVITVNSHTIYITD